MRYSCKVNILFIKMLRILVTGYFKTQKRPPAATNPMTDPSVMTEMLKGNVTNVLPMIVIGGWINWVFSGFVTSILINRAKT